MRQDMDKEVDKILESIRREDIGDTSPVKQETQAAESPARADQPNPADKGVHSKVEQLSKQKKRKSWLRWLIVVLVAVQLLSILMLIFGGRTVGDGGGGSDSGSGSLQGTWSLDGTTVYRFEEDGKGAMILPNKTYAFDYFVNEEEKTISIDYESEKAEDATYSYRVSEDKLVLTGTVGDGVVHEFTRTEQE